MKCSCILLALIGFFTGCEEPVYYKIAPEDIPAFKDGQVLNFKSTSGIFDSLEVKLSETEYVHDKRYHYERLYIQYSLKRPSGNTKFLFVQQGPTGSRVSNQGYYLDFISDNNSFTFSNGMEIQNAVLWKRSDLSKVTTLDIVEVLYHSHYGIVKYKFAQGLPYVLQPFE